MAEVVLAGVLGAAVLAIVLLHKNSQRQADRLAKVEAELAAEKIARITQQPLPLALPVDDGPEPVRRKRHLALYMGGAVAAFLASLGSRLRDLVRGRRAVAATVAASSVLVATSAFAYYKNTGSDETPDSGGQAPVATAPDLGDSDTQTPEPGATGEDNKDENGTTQRESTTSFGAGTAPLGQSGTTGDEHPGASQRDDGDQEAHSDQERPGRGASDAPATPAPAATQQPAQSPAPPPTADPEPSQPPATEPPADDDKPGDDGLCIGVPPLLELCLPGKAP
ncbi:hypothetical protein ABZ464_23480 [Streptomyces sp. NPDC005820]|uniref:hypothetical protein n=1 Tax=Streptomyces sp. NPDC005820 TaxID=3157069 RepID=UPI0033C3E0B8